MKKLSAEHKEKIRKSMTGRSFSEETINKMKLAQRKRYLNPEEIEKMKELKKNISIETKNKMRAAKIGKKKSDDFKNRRRIYMLSGGASYVNSFPKNFSDEWKRNLKEEMINGRAAYMNKFIKNPSKPEIQLRELVKELYPNCEFQYQVLNYSLDIVIYDYKIAIEYDGSYWHQDKEKDLKRQKDIEKEGFQFIRYVDKIPSLDILKNDIRNLVNKDDR